MVDSSPSPILISGSIYTSCLSNPFPEAILFQGPFIIQVGSFQSCLDASPSPPQIIKLDPSHLLLPGFVDSHVHPITGAFSKQGLSLFSCTSIFEAQKMLVSYIQKNPDLSWVFAYGLSESWYPNNLEVNKINFLDEVSLEKPISILRYDYHAYHCNSKAFELAKITNDTPNPELGIIEKDPLDNFTGVLHEFAMNLLRPAFPPLTEQAYEDALKLAIDEMLKQGVTNFVDAAVKENHQNAYSKVYSQSPYKEKAPRCSLSLCWNKIFFDRAIEEHQGNLDFVEKLKLPKTEKLRANTVKIFVDGVADSQTALMSSPYNQKHDGKQCDCHYGVANFTEEELNSIIAELHKRGIQVHFHAIGDKAINMAVNSVEYAVKLHGNKGDHRHYIAHLQILDPKDILRFKELRISTCFTPFWFQLDPTTVLVDELLGEERAKRQYPIQDFAKAGVLNTFGSDWPVTTLRPLDGIELAMTRQTLGGNEKDWPWHGMFNQLLSLEEAVLAYTIGSAWVAHRDQETGSLEVGKRADLVILDKNLWKCKKTEIHNAKVLITIVDGKVVYRETEAYSEIN